MRMRRAVVVATLGLLATALAVGECSSSTDIPKNSTAQQPSNGVEGVSQMGESMKSGTAPTVEFELNGITFTPVPSGNSFGCREPLRVSTLEERSTSP